MIFFTDSNIGNATVTSTLPMTQPAEKVKDIFLANYSLSSLRQIILQIVYTDPIEATAMGLCGTNIEEGTVVSIYGGNSIANLSLINTFTATEFLNQLFRFDSETHTHWQVSYTQLNRNPRIGFIYHGTYINMPDFVPALRNRVSGSTSEFSDTRQLIGALRYTSFAAEYTFPNFNREKAIEIDLMYERVQNAFPIMILEHELAPIDRLNKPEYAVISSAELPRIQTNRTDLFNSAIGVQGVF